MNEAVTMTAPRTNQIAGFLTVSFWKKRIPLITVRIYEPWYTPRLKFTEVTQARMHSFRLLLHSTNAGQSLPLSPLSES